MADETQQQSQELTELQKAQEVINADKKLREEGFAKDYKEMMEQLQKKWNITTVFSVSDAQGLANDILGVIDKATFTLSIKAK